jgi:hypothetical protein
MNATKWAILRVLTGLLLIRGAEIAQNVVADVAVATGARRLR